MPGELELLDDDPVQEADDVRAWADHVALVVERALERAGAAELLAALEDDHALAGASEVCRGGEAVVAAADDDRVPFAPGELGDRGREADLAEALGNPSQGKLTPVSSSETSQRRRPVSGLWALPTGFTTFGDPRSSMKPSGPMNWPDSTDGSVAA